MKKIILFLFLLSATIFGQSIWWIDTTSTGEEKKVYLGDFDTERVAGGMRFAKLPIKSDSSTKAALDSLTQIIDSLNVIINSIDDVETLLTSIDGKDFAVSAKQDSILDSLSIVITRLESQLTELQSISAEDFATAANQTILIGNVDGLETLVTTLNGYVDQLEEYARGVEDSLGVLILKDFATGAKQDIIETSLNAIETLITTLNGYTDNLETINTAIQTAVETIDNAVSGNEMLIAGGSTQTNDLKVTLDGETITVDGSAMTQPVSAASLPLPTGASTSDNQSALIDLLSGATNYYGQTDTVGAASIDTITCAGATAWIEGSIFADDTVEIAIDGAFTSGETWVILDSTETKLNRWDATISDQIFIRRYGTKGEPNYFIKLSSK